MPDKRQLIAKGLAAGDSDEALCLRLVGAGISDASARYKIARLVKDPLAAA